jgi:hypothetical protein
VSRFSVTEYTDNSGTVYSRPRRADYATDWEWLRADNAFNDRMAATANKAFASAFKGAK